jgi:cell wall-associated NlpC family hydrolase
MTTPAEFVAQARTMLGVPFRHQGRGATGVDCVGVPVLAAKALRLGDFDVRAYLRTPHDGSLQSALTAAGCVPCELMPGAIALMRWDHRWPQHVAVVTDHQHGLGLLHAYSTVGRVVEHRIDAAWRRRIVSVWSVPGVAYGA